MIKDFKNPEELIERIDSLILENMGKEFIPGAAFALVKNDEVIYQKGYGYGNLESKKEVDPNKTVFRIGSISKTVTAIAVWKLIDEGEISIDDSVEPFLNDIPVENRNLLKGLKIRHLLNHTGGFDQILTNRNFDNKVVRPSIKEFISNNLVLIRPAGETSCYETYGITLLGYIIEKVSGLPYSKYIEKEIFAGLGMQNSFVEIPENKKSDLAIGYGYEDDIHIPQSYEWYASTPASSIDTTVNDMTKLLVAVLKSDDVEGGLYKKALEKCS